MIHLSYRFFFFFVASLLLPNPLKGFMYMPSLLHDRYYKDDLASPDCNQRRTAFTNHFKKQCRYAASSTTRVRILLEEGNNFFDGEQLSSPYYHMSFKDEADELRYRIARRKVLGALQNDCVRSLVEYEQSHPNSWFVSLPLSHLLCHFSPKDLDLPFRSRSRKMSMSFYFIQIPKMKVCTPLNFPREVGRTSYSPLKIIRSALTLRWY
jgi:hypothetical protein